MVSLESLFFAEPPASSVMGVGVVVIFSASRALDVAIAFLREQEPMPLDEPFLLRISAQEARAWPVSCCLLRDLILDSLSVSSENESVSKEEQSGDWGVESSMSES